jgi:hypothetical protein
MSQVDTRTTTEQPQVTPHGARRTNRTAVWGLVLAILTLGGVGSILGIVLGAKARQQVRGSGEGGAGLAMAAIIVGVLTLIVAIAYWIVIAQHLGGSSGGGGGGSGGGGSGY